MLQTASKRAWGQLPYSVRRNSYRVAFHGQYRELQALRHSNQDHGLEPFDDHECIFVHVPKCAGISVSRALFGVLAGTHISVPMFQVIFDQEEFERYFKFTIVRNPWDRLVSAYFFLCEGGHSGKDRKWAEANLADIPDFGSFVRTWVTPDNVASWQHFKPQVNFICDSSGELNLDYVGRYETLAETYDEIRAALGFGADLAHHNTTRSRGQGYRDYYTAETRRIVAEVYERDIDLLGYEF